MEKPRPMDPKAPASSTKPGAELNKISVVAASEPHDEAGSRGAMPPGGPQVFISAVEPSADLHAAHLIAAARLLCPEISFAGVAGPKMAAAGCYSIFDMTGHASMLLGAASNIGRGVAMLNTCDRFLRNHHFDAAVVLDSPMLHFPLAGKAHALSIPVLYYIAPQMWAWGRYRIYKLRHRTTKVACILPFEEVFFRNEGIDAKYVGHPLAEQFSAAAPDAQQVERIRKRGTPLIAILPGSRKHVVESILPLQLETAKRIGEEFPKAAFGISVAGTNVEALIREAAARTSLQIELYVKNRAELLEGADLVLVASGTAALEVAFYARPMIVMYNASPLFYHLIGRWLLNTPYLSLPNILAGRSIVPEFMPYIRDIEPVAKCANELLSSPDMRAAMTNDLREVTALLSTGSASTRTAEMLLEMIRTHQH